jgi:flagellar biogenesis protein FliO
MLEVGAALLSMAALLWYLRKHGLAARASARRASRNLETLERLALAPQHTLHLVRAGEHFLVIGCSPAGCAVLEKLPGERTAGPSGVQP